MDAVEFVLEKRRMCRSFGPCCSDCELHKEGCCTDMAQSKERTEKAVELVEKWSKEHPKKTRMSEFLKQYPNPSMRIDDDYPSINPCMLNRSLYDELRCLEVGCCEECRKKYWTEEIK